MKYPAMMESGASVALVEGGVEDVDLGPLAPPRFLVPPEVRTSEDVEMRARRFDETFAPLASLTSEDVVIGCSAHGAEYVSQSKEALGKFQSHVRAVDLAHGPSGLVNSLEAGELCQLPIAAASGCVGLSLYSTATVARFTPALYRAALHKIEEWRVVDKAQVVRTVVITKTAEVATKTVDGVKAGWKWLKNKIDEKRNGGGLPMTDADAGKASDGAQ